MTKKRLTNQEKYRIAVADAMDRLRDLHDTFQANPTDENKQAYMMQLNIWGGEMLRENARLTELDKALSDENELHNKMYDKAVELDDENVRLREALEFYADEKNYTEARGTRIFGDVFYDNGDKARQALKGESE